MESKQKIPKYEEELKISKSTSDEKNEKIVEIEEKDCPICLMIMVEPCKLACRHMFCKDCMELIIYSKCPMCRAHISNNFMIKIATDH